MRKEIEVAVNWIADKFENPPIKDSGSGVADLFASVIFDNGERPSKSMIKKFNIVLSDKIEQDERFQDGRSVIIASDYGPCGILAKSLEESGMINFSKLYPWKTIVWVSKKSVKVQLGYRAEITRIFG